MKPNNKILLSYSSLNSALNEPHTWINKINGLKTYTTNFFEEGKKAHEIIQAHVTGKHRNELLKDIPSFPYVEEVDFDEKMKFTFDFGDKYIIRGYIDGFNNDKTEILEIKSSATPWSVSKFNQLMQWRIYALALENAKKVWLVNTPRDPNLWNEENIKIFNKDITQQDRDEAVKWLEKGIHVIENLSEFTLYPEKKSRWCFYENCPFCPKYDTA